MRLLCRMRVSPVPGLALIALLTLFAGACSVVPPRPLPTEAPELLWQQRLQQMAALESWSFNGRAALSGDDVPSRTVRVHWSQAPHHFDIAFLSLIGQRVAELSGAEGRVELRLPGEPPVTAADSRALLTAALGWSAPVESLRYWVLGLADPATSAAADPRTYELDARGRLSRLRQDGWIVEYAQYVEIEGLQLPRRLNVIHPEVRIRLVIDRWTPGQADARD